MVIYFFDICSFELDDVAQTLFAQLILQSWIDGEGAAGRLNDWLLIFASIAPNIY